MTRGALTAAALLSGVAALVYQLLWTRQLGLVLGNTVGAVSTVLASFTISSEVVEAAGLFTHVNRGALGDPRLRVVVDDGRNHLLLTDRRYDVVISEPSNPGWRA